LEHFYALMEYLYEADTETVVALILIDLGFPAGRMGFEYLKDAILLYQQNPEQLITYELYPNVGKRNGRVPKTQVEMSIRREIRFCLKRYHPEKWQLYFPCGISNKETGPSNLEMIIGITQVLRIWEACRENYKKKMKEGDDHEQNNM